MSAVIDEGKSRAYIVYSEFGPSLRTPRSERLASEFPGISTATIEAWLNDFKAMDTFIWKLAEEGGKANFHIDDFHQSFSRAYPWLNETGLDRAWSRCAYYIFHEGYGSWRTD
jgi:hypothetical protein